MRQNAEQDITRKRLLSSHMSGTPVLQISPSPVQFIHAFFEQHGFLDTFGTVPIAQMYMRNRLYLLLLGISSQLCAFAQSKFCPENMDLERGDFTNWVCNTGELSIDEYGHNYVNWWMTGIDPRQHVIVNKNSGVDPYGLFPMNNPLSGGFYSVRIGDNRYTPQPQAHRVTYTYAIPASSTNFAITYYYAMIMQTAGTAEHSFEERPRFQVRIVDVATNQEIPCGSMIVAPDESREGFEFSPVTAAAIYRDWTAVTVNLSKYAGKTVRLEFSASECTVDSSRKSPHNGHWAYAYVDVAPICSSASLQGTTICPGDTELNIKAPDGYDYYLWYQDRSFVNQISQAQVLHLNPLPAVGSVFPVVMISKSGFACRDTFYATITSAPNPVSDAGPDRLTCSKMSVQLGAPPLPDHMYAWTPAQYLTSGTVANPYTLTSVIQPTEFIVKTTNIETGCFSYDTTVVTPIVLDTASSAAGKTIYCAGETVDVTMTLANPPASIQWYNGLAPLAGATTPVLHTTTPGLYWARLINAAGCVDSTREYRVHVGGYPVVDFHADRDTQCVNVAYRITNATTVSPEEPVNYNWTFSDGTASQEVDPEKTFATPGIYTIHVDALSESNCGSSFEKQVTIMPNVKTDFTWDSVCIRRAVTFTNLSKDNASPGITYSWDFGNGATSSLASPAQVYYGTAGNYEVRLTGTAIGCEKAPQIVKRKVQANAPVRGMRYADKAVVAGQPSLLSARKGIGDIYDWQPHLYLNDFHLQQPTVNTGQAVQYLVNITDAHTCITIDTLKVIAMERSGSYIPNAFTPNNDGRNDRLIPFVAGIKSLEKFSIYNRSGNLVFSTNREGEGWDGRHAGTPAPTGVYVWMLECTLEDDRKIVEKGIVTLIR